MAVMEMADVCNRIARLWGAKFLEVDRSYVDFRLAGHDYHAWVDPHGVVVLELIEGDITEQTEHSMWIQGILEGKVRNDAGELVDAPQHYTY